MVEQHIKKKLKERVEQRIKKELRERVEQPSTLEEEITWYATEMGVPTVDTEDDIGENLEKYITQQEIKEIAEGIRNDSWEYKAKSLFNGIKEALTPTPRGLGKTTTIATVIAGATYLVTTLAPTQTEQFQTLKEHLETEAATAQQELTEKYETQLQRLEAENNGLEKMLFTQNPTANTEQPRLLGFSNLEGITKDFAEYALGRPGLQDALKQQLSDIYEFAEFQRINPTHLTLGEENPDVEPTVIEKDLFSEEDHIRFKTENAVNVDGVDITPIWTPGKKFGGDESAAMYLVASNQESIFGVYLFETSMYTDTDFEGLLDEYLFLRGALEFDGIGPQAYQKNDDGLQRTWTNGPVRQPEGDDAEIRGQKLLQEIQRHYTEQ